MGIQERIDNIFLLPTSFFGIVSGTLIGTSLSLIPALPSKDLSLNLSMMGLSITSLLISFVLFSYLTIKLEVLRDKMSRLSDNERHLSIHIKNKRMGLRLALFIGIMCVVESTCYGYLAYYW